ncbi:MAG: hypothetical protein AB1689_07370 [Thermodesulfobacteriota bacterium]
MANAGGSSVWLALFLVLGSALHFLGGNVADPDLWGHLRYGQMILEGHGLPREDVFSYTAAGAPFYDHEWLSDLVFASIYAVAGSAGLIAFKLLVGAAMLLAMWDATRVLGARLLPGERLHPLVAAAAMIAALAVISPGATFRPQLFTMLLLALETALLLHGDRRLREERVTLPWELAVLPVLIVIWANAHGGFLVGLGLLGCYGAATLAQESFARLRGLPAELAPRQLGALCALGVACAAMPLLNPYGVELYVYLATTLGMHDQISEWDPVELLSTGFLRFKIMVVVTVAAVALLIARRGRDAARSPLAWLVPFLAVAAAAAFRHQRHTVLYGIVAMPVVAVAAEQLRRLVLERRPSLRPRRQVFAAAALGAAAIGVLQLSWFGVQLARDGLDIRYGRIDYPVDAIEFMRTHDLRGNAAFPFEWGAYAISKLAPESRVFIDGRFEAVYPQQVIEDYFAFMHGTEGWERLLDDYPTEIVVVQRWREIHPRMFSRPDFAYVYSDPASLVFVRRTPTNDDALERLASVDRFDFPRPPTVFP